jgi:Tfp pilus assembly protein FimV
MMRKRRAQTDVVVPALTVAGLSAAVLYLLLSLISRPPDLSGRLAQVERNTGEAEQVLARSSTDSPYLAHAICEDPSAAPIALRQRLQSAAASTGLTFSNFSTTPGAPDEAIGGLEPLSLSFEASGRYDAVVSLLGALAKAEPQIFADKIDLKSQTSTVALTFSGRIFCSTTARL